jgi:transcriptional regulator with XRE-family HTH domain
MDDQKAVRLTPRLCKAARALIGWQQQDLAGRSGVSKSTIAAFERRPDSAKVSTMNNRALVQAFEAAGLEFMRENGGGLGVRWRQPRERGRARP